jgi:hypothetical protein
MKTKSEPAHSMSLVVCRSQSQRFHSHDLLTTSRLTGLHEGLIVEFARGGLVSVSAEPNGSNEPRFDEKALCRLRQIAQLHQQQKVNLRTIKLIVRLLDRLEEAEKELRILREQVDHVLLASKGRHTMG